MCGPGVALFRSSEVRAPLESWISRIDGLYKNLDEARKQGAGMELGSLIPPGQRFAPTASSFTIGTAFSDEHLRAFAILISSGPLGEWIRREIGSRTAWDLDQSWVRRQYAPPRYPRWHAPHGWHQDGALGFDFSRNSTNESCSRMAFPLITCWIALGPCGDQAPGLELVTRRFDGLLGPEDLDAEHVRNRFRAEEFWRPVLEAGDALLFRQDILHRTHVTPQMTSDRISVEARFFALDQIPEQFKDDRFICLDQELSIQAAPCS